MKFKDVKIGQMFKAILSKRLIKTSCGEGFYYDNFERLGEDEEVELISKCENCKHLRDNYNKYCEKSPLLCDEPEHKGYLMAIENPDSFSCSEFELKKGVL